ncbi:8-oxoguanine DNA glycosylase OGG fold protein [Streptomyces sp. NPDC003480]
MTSIVANTPARETLREALVATYVWGKGKSGSPAGSGPTTLHKILAAEDLLDEALDDAVTVLSRHGAVASYEGLRGRIPGFGPSFFTKFLYFAGKTVKPANGPEPLILDRVLPGGCAPWPRRSAGRRATTPTARSPPGSGRPGLVTPPLQDLPVLPARRRPPGGSDRRLALRRLTRPARIRIVQRCVDISSLPPRPGAPAQRGEQARRRSGGRGRRTPAGRLRRRRERGRAGAAAEQVAWSCGGMTMR